MAASEFDAFCRFAFAFLQGRGTRYLVIGGLAVVVVGEPRTTADADVIVFVSQTEAELLIAQAAEAGFELREDVERRRLEETGTMRFRKGRYQIDLPFPTPEDLILFKILAGRDKDILDATGIVRRHIERLDTKYLEKTLQPLCELAENMAPWKRLQEVLLRGRGVEKT